MRKKTDFNTQIDYRGPSLNRSQNNEDNDSFISEDFNVNVNIFDPI